MGWRAATDGKITSRGNSGCTVDCGIQDDSGVEPCEDKANLRMAGVSAAGGLPLWPRVFYRQ